MKDVVATGSKHTWNNINQLCVVGSIAAATEGVAVNTGLASNILVLILTALSEAVSSLWTDLALWLAKLLIALVLRSCCRISKYHWRKLINILGIVEDSNSIKDVATEGLESQGVLLWYGETVVATTAVHGRVGIVGIRHEAEAAILAWSDLVVIDTNSKIVPCVVYEHGWERGGSLSNASHCHNYLLSGILDEDAEV